MDPAHEWVAPYTEVVNLLADPSVARLRMWSAAQKAAGPAAVYRARALLVLAVYKSCWLRNLPCPVLKSYIQAAEMRADLSVRRGKALVASDELARVLE